MYKRQVYGSAKDAAEDVDGTSAKGVELTATNAGSDDMKDGTTQKALNGLTDGTGAALTCLLYTSFLNKVTARNLFRYKKRMLMTIGGIMGCTALVLCGFVRCV